jgi:hypothetical protein
VVNQGRRAPLGSGFAVKWLVITPVVGLVAFIAGGSLAQLFGADGFANPVGWVAAVAAVIASLALWWRTFVR